MPYVDKLLKKIDDKVSDFGWEVGCVEYDIDMIPDTTDEEEFERMADIERCELDPAFAMLFRNRGEK